MCTSESWPDGTVTVTVDDAGEVVDTCWSMEGVWLPAGEAALRCTYLAILLGMRIRAGKGESDFGRRVAALEDFIALISA